MSGQSDQSQLDQSTQRYCVWIVGVGDWQPAHALDVPPRAQAVELAEDDCLSAAQADAYIAGFNERALADGLPYWAMRVRLRSEPQQTDCIRPDTCGAKLGKHSRLGFQ